MKPPSPSQLWKLCKTGEEINQYEITTQHSLWISAQHRRKLALAGPN